MSLDFLPGVPPGALPPALVNLEFMTYFDVIIISIVEGITEFLPISSTGHMILTSRLLNLSQTNFLKTFEISIQLGAILAVVVLYWRKLMTEKIWDRLITAFIPTAVIGLIFYKLVKTYLLGSNQVVLWALLIGGVILIAFELIFKEKEGSIKEIKDISYKKAAIIGVFQSIAIVPGVSRSAATILGGLSLGLSRKLIVEFSFLLAVPTMAAATALDLYKNAGGFTASQFWMLLVGFVISFVVAVFSIKFLLAFVKKYSFIGFGVYRIILALSFWWLVL